MSRLPLIWKLLLVPFIAVLSFAVYLIYSSLVLSSNNAYLKEVRDIQFPVLDTVEDNSDGIEKIINALNTAATSGETAALNTAKDTADAMRDRYLKLQEVDTVHKEEIKRLVSEFDAYFSLAFDISQKIAAKSGRPDAQTMLKMGVARDNYITHAGEFRSAAELRFEGMVKKALDNSERARIFGPVIGIIMLIVLMGLTLIITRGILLLEKQIKDRTQRLASLNLDLENENKKLKVAEKQIEFLAYHDVLTGLPNRQLAIDHMRLAFANADRTETKAAILFLDLDNFKTINDSFGHAIGDVILKVVTRCLGECVRDTDTISRQGGDEFLILLTNVKDIDAITGIAEKILKKLEETFSVEKNEISTSLSIGIAVYPDDSKDIDSILNTATTAMRYSKEAGRNTYRFYNEQMNIDAVEHQRIRVGLRRSLGINEFVLYYQPQVDLTTGAVVGAEALIRWNHPELGLMPPGHFIPTAEESGLVIPMGNWVLQEACRQAAAWREAGLPSLVMAVNISTLQFKRGNLEQSVLNALAESGLPPACLELELTESILIQEPEKVLESVNRLKSHGILLSIDDFGTGYSSLSYLKRFNVDKLKIDQSFIRDMINDNNDAAIVRAIIQMARSLNIKIIAEGVEDEHTAAFLRLQYCDEAQGYYFARPLPADEFARYLANKQIASA